MKAVQFLKKCLQAMKEIVTPELRWKKRYLQMRSRFVKRIFVRLTEKLEEAFADNEEWLAVLGEAVYQYQKKTVRKMILKDHKRPDGRAIDTDQTSCSRS